MPSTAPLPKLSELLPGESTVIAEVRERVAEAMADDAAILLEGERGTGRERVARALHDGGPRRGNGFVRLVCDEEASALPEALGRQLGRAAGGTLLVKDIAQVGRSSQRRLAKVLRSRGAPPDVRLVAATGFDLGRAVADELFDAELAERLVSRRIALPSLRARPGDIAPLAGRFARETGEALGRGRMALSSRAVDRLIAYPWPGNIGELKDVVSRAAFRARKLTIELPDVDVELPQPVEERVPIESLSFEEMVRSKIEGLLRKMDGYPIEDLYDEVIARVERPLIELVLKRADGNQVRAARMLGLNRNTLRKKIVERGLPLDEKRKR